MARDVDSANVLNQRAIGWTVFAATTAATLGGHLLEKWVPAWAAWGLAYSTCFAASSGWLQRLRDQQPTVLAAVARGLLIGAVVAAVKLAIG